MQGWHREATLNTDCFKKQIAPSPGIPTCMAQTPLWSFPSSSNRCPCNTFASAGLLIKIAQGRACVTWPVIIGFIKKERKKTIKQKTSNKQTNKQPQNFFHTLFASLGNDLQQSLLASCIKQHAKLLQQTNTEHACYNSAKNRKKNHLSPSLRVTGSLMPISQLRSPQKFPGASV